ncbi:hypothetical protein [Thalassovita aquimarina]|uniref:Uncharacterized protein n=1 Tax=Thalassovita aquimarina TaxID=2785917 RepID=A0ABS5HWT9_9RHOB|nr:hypothetical protein [Thalassovita aquimarina]MBR9653390.1 hypothetical protein [Thalassovita aquimarina]
MSEISELERRITAAMDRIAKGVESFGAAAETAVAAEPDTDASDETAELRQALEDEKLANAQLEERLKALRAKLDRQETEAELQLRDLKSAMAGMEAAQQQLKATSEELRGANAALREATAETAAEAVNAALQAELDALRAERAAEAAETAAIAATLETLIDKADEKEEA